MFLSNHFSAFAASFQFHYVKPTAKGFLKHSLKRAFHLSWAHNKAKPAKDPILNMPTYFKLSGKHINGQIYIVLQQLHEPKSRVVQKN